MQFSSATNVQFTAAANTADFRPEAALRPRDFLLGMGRFTTDDALKPTTLLLLRAVEALHTLDCSIGAFG